MQLAAGVFGSPRQRNKELRLIGKDRRMLGAVEGAVREALTVFFLFRHTRGPGRLPACLPRAGKLKFNGRSEGSGRLAP